jgi:hypothetical protein
MSEGTNWSSYVSFLVCGVLQGYIVFNLGVLIVLYVVFLYLPKVEDSERQALLIEPDDEDHDALVTVEAVTPSSIYIQELQLKPIEIIEGSVTPKQSDVRSPLDVMVFVFDTGRHQH